MTEQGRWYSAGELAGLPGLPSTERNVRARAEREGWESRPRQVGKGREYAFGSLPPETQTALLLRDRTALPPLAREARTEETWPRERIEALWARYEREGNPAKETARQRLRALHAVEALCRAGTGVVEARELVAAQMQRKGVRGGSPASIARWQKAVEGAHRSDWLALLVPAHSGRATTAEMEPEAWELFKADYLRLEQPAASACYERLERIAATRPEWKPLPSLRTFQRRIEREVPRPVLVLAREGEEALMRIFPAQERDRSGFGALDAVNADGHVFDVFVRFPDGRIVRPVLVGWQDLGSGKLLGWRLGETESTDLVRLAYADVVRGYGIPRAAWLDNGRSFASKYLTGGTRTRYRFKVRDEDPVGVMVALGTEVHWVTPYHGQAKPIERAWRDLCETISRHPACAGAYTGNNPMAKPANYGSRAVPLETFQALVATEIAAHNAREGRRAAVCKGRSFDAVFAEKYARTPIRKATEEQLRALLLASEAVHASRADGTVRLAGNRYWCEALAACAGRRVVLRFDPANLHGAVHAYELDGTYIGEAACTVSVGFADADAAREHARAKRQFRRASKQKLEAERRMEAAAVVAQLPDVEVPELPAAAVLEPIFNRPGKAVQRAHEEAEEGPSALDIEMYRRAVALRNAAW